MIESVDNFARQFKNIPSEYRLVAVDLGGLAKVASAVAKEMKDTRREVRFRDEYGDEDAE